MCSSTPSLKVLSQLSKHVPDQHECLQLAIFLEIGRDEISKVQRSQETNVGFLAFNVLSKWVEIYADKATGDVLIKALKDIGRRDLALETERRIQAEVNSSSDTSSGAPEPQSSAVQPVQSDGRSNEGAALLKIFEQLGQNFSHYGICDSLAIHLEVNTMEVDFVRDFQEKNPDLRTNYPLIAKEILKRWSRDVAQPKGWSVQHQVDMLYQILSEELQRSDFAEKLLALCQKWFSKGTR